MISGLFASLWWAGGSAILVAALAAFFVFYLGRTLTRRLVYIGLGVVAASMVIGYSQSLIEQGRQEQARIYDGAIDSTASKNRAKEHHIEAVVSGRDEQLGAKVRRIRQNGTDERDWIKEQEKNDGRIDPQTIKLLER